MKATEPSPASPAGSRGAVWRACWRERHFLAAAGILAVATIGWDWTMAALGWVTRKEAVPWPNAVLVDTQCRVISFPDRLGPYELVGDGVFDKAPDGRPDGDVVLTGDVLESLKINTALDQMRVGERRSNWYLTRIYRDTRLESSYSPFRQWRLEVHYYTGGLDKVPHVPDRCLVAGGATLLPSWSGELKVAVPAGTAPWDHLTINRVGYEMTDRIGLSVRRYAQYYVFSLNGEPEGSWMMVRLKLGDPRTRYCYFAKVQVAPLGEITDVDEADKAVHDFLAVFMPAVAALLPMPADVRALNASPSSGS
ncbi:MAG: hypothetical protein MUP47_11530 [Phycisphaerae bacterium]|nr:hypothetical protein [Phycisphaerae bacterium]